ncbi:hypothetical protein Tsp_10181 [Trichinella spiralis]|uniref:hypothetical protein n=1 Tax=Trichinella spiralis TaxID=6334 RepID=UPI0001EFDBD2|nr:hypothetical protein Tsp_10181 [Trichinella spiralis]
MFWITFVVFITTATAFESVCQKKCAEPRLTPELERYCTKRDGHWLTDEANCCALNNGTVIILNLRQCNLSCLNSSMFEDGETNLNRSNIEMMDLSDNPIAPDCVSANFWTGMTRLNYLILPHPTKCPGGKDAWEYAKGNKCIGQVDWCKHENCTLWREKKIFCLILHY